jgi:two-component system, NtrC family, nitrogen regulation sensor histidine kinase NtrY
MQVKSIIRKHVILWLGVLLFPLGLVVRHIPGGNFEDTDSQLQLAGQRVQTAMDKLERDMEPVLGYLQQNELIRFTDLNGQGPAHFFIVEGRRMMYWSGNQMNPVLEMPTDSLPWQLLKQTNGHYLVRQWEVAGEHQKVRKVFAGIPLFTRYKIDNKYLSSGPSSILPPQVSEVGATQELEFLVCPGFQPCLFSVSLGPVSGAGAWKAQLTVWVWMGAFVLVVWGLARIVFQRFQSGENQVLGLLCILLATRAAMLALEFPTAYLEAPLFDPRNFASSSLNPSLGDLCLNLLSVLVFAIVLFLRHRHFRGVHRMVGKHGFTRILASLFWYSFGVGGFLLVFVLFQTIYHNSQLTYDITATLRFDVLRETALMVYILGSLVVFLMFHVGYRMATRIWQKGGGIHLGLFSFTLVVWGLALEWAGQPSVWVMAVALLYFVLILLLRFDQALGKLTFFSFLYFFSLGLCIALLGAGAIYRFEEERILREKDRFARQMLIENDNLAEFLLAEAADKIQNDAFIKNRLSSPFVSKDIISEKIRQVFLSKYFDKYDVQISLYNASGKPFDLNPTQIDYELMRTRFQVESFATAYPGLYLVNRPGEDITRRYLQFAHIEKYGYVIGYVLIELKLKRIIPESVYPELLVDDRFISVAGNRKFSYAVYSQQELEYNYGDFNYVRDFPVDILEHTSLIRKGITHRGAHHLAMLDDDGRYIVVSSPLYGWTRMVANFSFLFLLIVFFIGLSLTGLALYYFIQKKRLNYSARIQLYLNLAFFFPLLVLSLANIGIINRSFKAELAEEYFQRARNIADNLSADMDEYLRNVFEGREELSSRLGQAAKFANVDANLFNVGGRLVATSQPQIYENALISAMLHPVVAAQLIEQRQSLSTLREQVGSLSYNATYVPVKSFDTGRMIGILSIPFFESDTLVEARQIGVLSTIMSIFTFTFLAFLIISYFASKWLTFPLKFITQKLKKTTLSGFNEPLVWPSDDEIGLMVGEYNRMLVNLEDSKRALARSEKESAWREMAQQVAHEIKNPLTPMKLTLQHLHRLVRQLEGPAREVERPIESLLHQVDTLSDIASSFSDFAKMPIPEHKRFELTSLVRKTLNLHSNHEGVTVDWELPDNEVFVMGDEQLMGRILANILINASQSGASHVKLGMKLRDMKKVTLAVEDNGSGISEEIRSKVFMPHFTTKETGSGIGLAIAKHGVEHAGGKIWFETHTGKGTVFFVELPLLKE